MPDLTGSIYRHSAFLFVTFFILTLWAFWSSYYGVLERPHSTSVHLHGISMTLWCVMLIMQALLIRYRKHHIHRVTGKLSFLLVPFILVAGVIMAHDTIGNVRAGTTAYYYLAALMFNSLIVFAILYILAIVHRKTPATHARYMICTILPLMTPVTDRIIYKNFRELVSYVPVIEGMPVIPTIGFLLANILLCVLLIWDWRAHRRLNVFPFVLGLLVLYHISVLTFYRYGFWRTAVDLVMS